MSDTETITHAGLQFHVELPADNDHGAPWVEEDGHGPVREGSRGYHGPVKRPGEWVLSGGGRNERTYLYDMRAAVALARADGWGSRTAPEGATAGQIAAAAAREDFENLRRFCAGQWEYIGVVVTEIRPDGTEGENASLWGIEDEGDYWREVARELAEEIARPRLAAWRVALGEARTRRAYARAAPRDIGAPLLPA